MDALSVLKHIPMIVLNAFLENMGFLIVTNVNDLFKEKNASSDAWNASQVLNVLSATNGKRG
jgi:hypothetical protein